MRTALSVLRYVAAGGQAQSAALAGMLPRLTQLPLVRRSGHASGGKRGGTAENFEPEMCEALESLGYRRLE